MGKRDVGYDAGLPRPLRWFRPGRMPAPATIPAGCSITSLNDQHAHMKIAPEAPFDVGDVMGLGIAHPCTTFERWQILMLVDERLDVIGAVRTFF